MEIRKSKPTESYEVKKFYKKLGRKWNTNSQNFKVIAKKNDEIIGILSIDEEKGYPILKELLVDEAFSSKGIATKILFESERYLQGKKSYCIPFVHLKGFYKKFGYEAIEFNKAPIFLKKALLLNNKPRKYANIERVIIMRKHRSIENKITSNIKSHFQDRKVGI